MRTETGGRPRIGGAAWCATAVLAVAAGCAGPARAASSDHAEAVGAVADTQAALREIVHAESATADERAPYVRAAQRALNAIVGKASAQYVSTSGDPGDATGALGHVERLLDRRADSVWTKPVAGVQVNLVVATRHLERALQADGVDEFQSAASDALASLQLALGRASVLGSLGGLTGALATTALGVPQGASVVSGCGEPARAPAYGVVHGYLLFAALPLEHGDIRLPQEMGERRLTVRDRFVIIHTPAEQLRATLCAASGPAAQAGAFEKTAAHASTGTSPGAPQLYTLSQARAGRKIFGNTCTSCHGQNLQGTAAPAIAGDEFLKTAQSNGWSVGDIRYVVVSNMPLNAPHSLTDQQYAEVIAFVLASNCYPAGATPFPTRDSDRLDHAKLHPLEGVKPDHPKLGTCDVK